MADGRVHLALQQAFFVHAAALHLAARGDFELVRGAGEDGVVPAGDHGLGAGLVGVGDVLVPVEASEERCVDLLRGQVIAADVGGADDAEELRGAVDEFTVREAQGVVAGVVVGDVHAHLLRGLGADVVKCADHRAEVQRLEAGEFVQHQGGEGAAAGLGERLGDGTVHPLGALGGGVGAAEQVAVFHAGAAANHDDVRLGVRGGGEGVRGLERGGRASEEDVLPAANPAAQPHDEVRPAGVRGGAGRDADFFTAEDLRDLLPGRGGRAGRERDGLVLAEGDEVLFGQGGELDDDLSEFRGVQRVGGCRGGRGRAEQGLKVRVPAARFEQEVHEGERGEVHGAHVIADDRAVQLIVGLQLNVRAAEGDAHAATVTAHERVGVAGQNGVHPGENAAVHVREVRPFHDVRRVLLERTDAREAGGGFADVKATCQVTGNRIDGHTTRRAGKVFFPSRPPLSRGECPDGRPGQVYSARPSAVAVAVSSEAGRVSRLR